MTPPVKESFAKFVSTHRLKPSHLAFCVLFVGWVPSLMLAYYSFSVLSRTLENKTAADAESLVRSLSQHVENELDRTGETMDYYRTLPVTANLLQPGAVPTPGATPAAAVVTAAPAAPAASLPKAAKGHWRANATTTLPAAAPTPPVVNAPPNPQEWLAAIFYPQKRLDGMFLTDAAGRLVAAVPKPASSDERHGEFNPAPWKDAAEKPGASFVVSPIYPRASDGRLVASVVVAVRDPAGTLLGFLGSDILVERLGRRLRGVEMVNPIETSVQILDQDARPLFTPSLKPNLTGQDGIDSRLLHLMRQKKSGTRESGCGFTSSPGLTRPNGPCS